VAGALAGVLAGVAGVLAGVAAAAQVYLGSALHSAAVGASRVALKVLRRKGWRRPPVQVVVMVTVPAQHSSRACHSIQQRVDTRRLTLAKYQTTLGYGAVQQAFAIVTSVVNPVCPLGIFKHGRGRCATTATSCSPLALQEVVRVGDCTRPGVELYQRLGLNGSTTSAQYMC
jgi:hypothetical protein